MTISLCPDLKLRHARESLTDRPDIDRLAIIRKRFRAVKTSLLLRVALLLFLVSSVSTNAQTVLTLHSFSALVTKTNIQGADPVASLILSGNTLYGTTPNGGGSYQGTVFKINMDGSGYAALYSFTGSNDGANPAASLALIGNTLYGTTENGGASNNGTVFAINTDGSAFTNLYTFTGGNDGGKPVANLIFSGGMLYGTTKGGGQGFAGAVFAVATNGIFLQIFTALAAEMTEQLRWPD